MRQLHIISGPDTKGFISSLESRTRTKAIFEVAYQKPSATLPIGFVNVTINSITRGDDTGDFWHFTGVMDGPEGETAVRGQYNTATKTGLIDR